MKTKTSMLITLLLVGVLALAACGGNTAETEPAEAGEVVTMYVGPELAECTGEGPQTCMMIKETPDGEYQFFYNLTSAIYLSQHLTEILESLP